MLVSMSVCVSVLPSIRTRQSEVNATADINQSVMLACDADGFPEPTVTWARYVTPTTLSFNEHKQTGLL